jgi:hypothetical protein
MTAQIYVPSSFKGVKKFENTERNSGNEEEWPENLL